MGILANSASVAHASSSSDDTKSGYLNQEPISLSVSVSGTTYSWGLASPVDSVNARIRGDDQATPSLIPDVAGYYVITCMVDSTTTYVLRISVTDTVVATLKEALRLQPKADAQVPQPAAGLVLYCSSTQSNALCVKDASGNVFLVDLTPVV